MTGHEQFGRSTAGVKPNRRGWKGGLSTGHDGLAMECVRRKSGPTEAFSVEREDLGLF